MWAREIKSDYTTVGGGFNNVVGKDGTADPSWSDWERLCLVAPGGRAIALDPSEEARRTGNINQQGTVEVLPSSGDVAERFLIRLDQSGDEAGSFTQVTVDWPVFRYLFESN